MLPTVGPEDCAIHDFAVPLFHELGNTNRPRLLRTQKELQLLICGKHKMGKADVIIIDRTQDDVILAVEEDKHPRGCADPLSGATMPTGPP